MKYVVQWMERKICEGTLYLLKIWRTMSRWHSLGRLDHELRNCHCRGLGRILEGSDRSRERFALKAKRAKVLRRGRSAAVWGKRREKREAAWLRPVLAGAHFFQPEPSRPGGGRGRRAPDATGSGTPPPGTVAVLGLRSTVFAYRPRPAPPAPSRSPRRGQRAQQHFR